MSFFKKGKPRTANKRKFTSNKDEHKSNKKKFPLPKPPQDDEEIDNDDDDEEIDSDEFGEDEEVAPRRGGLDQQNSDDEESEAEQETAEDKRLRLAKKYLQEIEKEEKQRAEDKDIDENIADRLNNDYLDSIGRLKRKVADFYTGYDATAIKSVKHKLQKLPVTCLCLSSDDRYLFSGSKTSVVVKWELETMKAIGTLDCQVLRKKTEIAGRSHLTLLAISTDFKFLALSDMNKNIYICCPTTLQHLHTFEGHRDTITGIVFRKDTHTLYSTSKDRSVKIWSLDEMAYVETLFGHQYGITAIDALSRERVVTSGGSDQSIRVWKIAEESQLLFRGHEGSIEGVKLISDENFLSSSDDGSLCSWGIMRKKPLCRVTLTHGRASNGDANWITAIATYVNTDLIASGSCDGVIRLWKLVDNCKVIKPHLEIPVKGFINSLIFTGDGKRLIVGVGQEHRLGRWWRIKDSRNCVMVIPLTIKDE